MRRARPWSRMLTALVTNARPYDERINWQPEPPRRGLVSLLAAWAVAAASVWVGAWVTPGVSLGGLGTGVLVAAVLAVLNAVLPPIVGAMRLPFTFVLGFLLVLL